MINDILLRYKINKKKEYNQYFPSLLLSYHVYDSNVEEVYKLYE